MPNNELDAPVAANDELDAIVARQNAQQSQILPTERQPPMQAVADPQQEALQHPELSPEEVIGGLVAGPLARAAIEGAPAVAKGLGALAADEAGVVQLSGRGPTTGVSPDRVAAGYLQTPAQTRLEPLQRLQQTLGHEITPPGEVLNLEQSKRLLDDAQAAHEAGIIPTSEWQRAAQHHEKAQRRGYAEGGEVAPDASPTPDANVNVFNPEGTLVSIPQGHVQEATQDLGYRIAAPEEVHAYSQEQKYGTLGQQAKAGLEGLAQGVAGPLAPAAEKLFGVKPEDIRGREEVNPVTHGAGQLAGLAGSAAVGFGEGAVLEGAGQAIRSALPAGKATFVSQVGPEAVKSAFEMGLFQGSEELSKKFKEDPNQTAESAMHDIGLATVIGGVFGGPIGAALQKAKYAGLDLPEVAEPQFVSQLDRDALEAGHLETSIRHADNLPESDKEGMLAGLLDRSEKTEAPEVRAAAERLGIDPLEGMLSANKWVQKAEDSLINGAPTYSGVRRAKLYNEVYGKASNAAEEALGDASRYTKAELGDIMKKSISEQIEEQNAPIKAMYEELKASKEILPLRGDIKKELGKSISELQELRVSPGSPEGALASRIIKESQNYRTVDDLQLAKSMLNRSVSPTASTGEKRMAAILSDKLTAMEEKSVERHATEMMAENPEVADKLQGLIGQRKEAAAKYKEFINKVKTLSEQLGKGRVYGMQDALNFINDRLTPEEIVQRLGSTKDSGFRKFFAKEYPEQHSLMQEYQKGALREKASATGTLSPKVLFNNINKLEPEIQNSIFTKGELQKIKDAETVIRSIPKDFNPSGTSHAIAMRDFFVHPKGAIASNLRDFAMEKFIKGVASSPDVAKAVKLAQATIAGDKLASKAIQAVFNKGAMPLAAIPVIANREKLARMVDHYSANPDKMFNNGDNNPVPEYAQAFATTSARAVQYLASIRPNTEPQAPLDPKREATSFEKAKYNNALDIAQQPLSVLDKIQKGTLTPQDINTLQIIYPSTYNALREKIMASVVSSVDKGTLIPYSTRLQLSSFLGQPLDSSMTPASILTVQGTRTPSSSSPAPQLPSTKTAGVAKLSGLAKASQTPLQARQAEKIEH